MLETTIESLAKNIFKLFVANPKAIAIQIDSGAYITKYVSFDYKLIENMYRRRGSAGCYQQGFKNNKIKWICLDFDCNNKDQPNVPELLDVLKKTILQKLRELNISYLLEFSGRRGIHVWILFSTPITKENGFRIITELSKYIYLDETLYGLDKFPATDSFIGNKVGKQVKIPLSIHKSGTRSYFLDNNEFITDIEESSFFEKQLSILEKYKPNSIDDVNCKLNIHPEDLVMQKKYKKVILCDSLEIQIDEIINVLSEIKVYKQIFKRLELGVLNRNDWNVLLGTFGPLDDNGDALISVLSRSTAYDETTTLNNIQKWKQFYFPATFEYLYNLYDLDIETFLNKNDTSFDYLKSKIEGFNFGEITKQIQNTAGYTNIQSIINREKNYLLNNDENIPIGILNQFNNISNFDLLFLEDLSKDLQKAKSFFPKDYIIYERKESPERIRKMISLNMYDRVFTSYLAIKLSDQIKVRLTKSESFSYKIANLSNNEIFYNWYSGWSLFVDKIRAYLDVPYLDDWGVFSIDIRHFYDSIDFAALIELIKTDLDSQAEQIYNYLVSDFNEKLMREINDNKRIGVPQGPAYARIISEFFLDKIIQNFEAENDVPFVLYRYVDDIVVFYPTETNGKELYDELTHLLEINGLELNEDKSAFFGQLRDLTQDEKNRILHKGKFSYLLQENSSSIILSNDKEKEIFNYYIGDSFNLDFVAFIFNYKTKEKYRWNYYCKFKKEIFSSLYGRGSIYMRFYKFIFMHSRYLELALKDNDFSQIPIDSLNFKNFLAMLYYCIKNREIDCTLLQNLFKKYLCKLNLTDTDTEEEVILQAIKQFMEEK